VGTKQHFQTFCQNCGCPAYFHKVIEEPVVFPPDLAETLKAYNLQPRDINFNSILTAFQVGSEEKAEINFRELAALLKEEGIEIVSFEKRKLLLTEAVLMKGKIFSQ